MVTTEYSNTTTLSRISFLWQWQKNKKKPKHEEAQSDTPPPSIDDHQEYYSPTHKKTGASEEFERRLFDYFDENGDGKISPWELRNCMRRTSSTGLQELSVEDITEAVAGSSTGSDGVDRGMLGFNDFVKLIVEDAEEGEEEKERNLKEAFRAYVLSDDDDDEGIVSTNQYCNNMMMITPRSLRRALLRQLGESKSIEECKVMIRHFDINGDGVLSFHEFRLMMI